MRPRRHSIFPPLVILLMIAASLIFFLPAAVSMNSQTPFAASQETASTRTVIGSSEAAVAPETLGGITAHPGNGGIVPAIKNEKGSLSLKTAAIVGTSAAGLAAVLVRE